MQSRIKGGLFQGVDFLAVLYYLLLVAAGCICITAASFDEETADFFAFSHFYIKQYMWVTAVLVVALVVLLLDVRYYHMWAYPLYIIGIVVMIGVLIAGKEVNGAKSWIELGSLRIQPVEFVKIATALALGGGGDVALEGVGATEGDRLSPVFDAYVTPHMVKEIRAQGAVATVCGHFIDAQGRPVCSELSDRIISVELNRLKRIALVIGVAWGQEKVKAIKACLVGSYISALATDQATAESLLA